MNDIHDEWQIKGNYLLRRHYLPRSSTYEPCEATCPIPVEHLGKTRSTFFGDTNYHDRWHMKNKEFPKQWTGTTRFKILPNYRKRLATDAPICVKVSLIGSDAVAGGPVSGPGDEGLSEEGSQLLLNHQGQHHHDAPSSYACESCQRKDFLCRLHHSSRSPCQ